MRGRNMRGRKLYGTCIGLIIMIFLVFIALLYFGSKIIGGLV